MGKLQQIQDFIASEPIAMAIVSRDPRKFGFAAFRELKEKGRKHIRIQKNAETGYIISTPPLKSFSGDAPDN